MPSAHAALARQRSPSAQAGDQQPQRRRQWDAQRVDVVIFDVAIPVSTPERNGLDLIAHARAILPNARMIVLTMHTESEYAARALKAGALRATCRGRRSTRVI